MKLVKENNIYLLIWIFCSLVLLINGCKKSSRYDVKFLSKIYVENLVIKQKYSQDSLKIMQERLFKNYGITQEEFENELNSFADNQKKWSEFFNEAQNYLTEIQQTKK
ncbi:hypothetical protein ABRY23_08675 [Melioribacteraceae bacterium 4301-Me]|uniref:hypothetical protein n=1 Tax=Pyranulibacter aquaticus TaxID=3163344 RepID=UPI003598264A